MDDDAMQADTSQEFAGGMDDAGPMVANAPTDGSTQSKSLSPVSYAKWIRSAERKLLNAASSNTPPSDAELENFRAALDGTSSDLLLSAHNWRLLCALSLWDLINRESANATGGVSLLNDVEKVRSCLDLHETATRSSSGSALDLSAFLSYVSLLLRLHYDFEEVEADSRPVPFWQQEDDDEDEPREWTLVASQDLLKEWTGLQNGPRFAQAHHRPSKYTLTGGYDFSEGSAVLRIPTRSQVRDAGQEPGWDAVLGQEAVRARLHEVAARVKGEINWSHLVWNQVRDFEVVHLQRDKTAERVEAVKRFYMEKLSVPHRQHEATAQAFSSFLSDFCPPEAYEKTMVDLQQHGYSRAKSVWSTVEALEDKVLALASSADDEAAQWPTWQEYLQRAQRSKEVDSGLVSALYERSIAFLGLPRSLTLQEELTPPDEQREHDTKKEKVKTKRDQRLAEQARERQSRREAQARRETLWLDYITFLTSSKAHINHLLDVLERSVRMIPSSGRLWAMYTRQLARLRQPVDRVAAVFNRAIEGGECLADDEARLKDGVETRNQVVELLVSRIDAERHGAAISLANEQDVSAAHALAALPQDANKFLEVYAVIQYSLDEHQVSCSRDQSLRLQRLASTWTEAGVEGMASLAVGVWEKTIEQQPNNSRAYIEAAAFYVRQGGNLGPVEESIRKARSLYQSGSSRPGIDATERLSVLNQWREFETVYGSVDDILKVEQKIRKEQEQQWDAYRKQQEEYAQWYSSVEGSTQAAATVADASVPDIEMSTAETGASSSKAAAGSQKQGQKRKVERDDNGTRAQTARSPPPPNVAAASNSTAAAVAPAAETPKKGRHGDGSQPTRDRENSSVLISGLPEDAKREDLETLFADCGPIREIDGPRVTPSRGSTTRTSSGVVEFMDRSSILSARSKNKTQLRGHEIHVALGWQCTLYVTNFPSDTDDYYIRNMFGKYGSIYDVRWPSKKFDTSRRFCYVQYTTPQAATEAQGALHEFSMGGVGSLQVLLSDPMRKKQRTDANAKEREVYVTGIPRNATEDQVKAAFEDATGAQIQRFEMPLRPNGKPQGRAQLEFRTPLDAQRAVTVMNGTSINGSALKVAISHGKRR